MMRRFGLAIFLLLNVGVCNIVGAQVSLERVRRSLFRSVQEEESWMKDHSENERQYIERDLSQKNGEGCVNILIHYKHSHDRVSFGFTHAEAKCCTQEEYQKLRQQQDVVLLEYDEDIVEAESYVTTSIPGFPDIDVQEYQPWGVERVLGEWETLSPHSGEWESTINVCVVDSGVMVDHDDGDYDNKDDPMVMGEEFNVGDLKWHNPSASAWHGTHVAGIICADSGNGKGASSMIKGCQTKIKLMFARVFDDRAMPSAKMSDVDLAVEWCANNNAHVINLSLSTLKPSFNSMMIYRSIALANNCLVVAAAGNRGPNERGAFPASYPDVISVGATDEDDRAASFSQKGANLVAPGKGVLSLSIDYGVREESTGDRIAAVPMIFSAYPEETVAAAACDCGFSDSPCDSCDSAICIIERNDLASVDLQVKNAEDSGCAGSVVYSESDWNAYGAGYDFLFSSSIPVAYVNKEDGERLKTMEGNVSISFRYPYYRVGDGTSQAAPHVAASIAILMGVRPSCGASQVRRALEKSAKPLLDNASLAGKGLVRLVEAYQALLEDPHCGDREKAAQFAMEVAGDSVGATVGPEDEVGGQLGLLRVQKAQRNQANDGKVKYESSSRNRGSGSYIRGQGGNRG